MTLNLKLRTDRKNIERRKTKSSYEIELRNRVKKNDVTHRVTNSKIFV